MTNESYQVRRYPRSRRVISNYVHTTLRKHVIHALLEIDVTEVRRRLHAHKERTGETLSLTAYVIACLARVVGEHKELHAYRSGRDKIIIFDDVDVSTLVERQAGGQRIATPHVIRAVNTKSFRQIHDEIREAQDHEAGEFRQMDWFGSLPGFLMRWFWLIIRYFPRLKKRYSGTVSVTAVGMFGSGGGWGIPLTDYTLQLTIGGIAERPGVVSGAVAIREYLAVTISVDHDLIDGAPAARLAGRLRELIEAAEGFEE